MAFKKYGKIRRPGHSSVQNLFADESHPFIITEKMDGNNFRFQRDGNELRFGSRKVDLGTDVGEIGGMFDDVSTYLNETIDVDQLRALEDEWSSLFGSEPDVSFVLFGENAVQHTIDEYDWDLVPQFQLFDVWVQYGGENGEWLPWYSQQTIDEGDTDFSVKGIADELGIFTVPVVETTVVGEFIDDHGLEDYEVPESVYRDDGGPAEGVVFRNMETGTKAKYISEEFAERHRSAKSKDMDADQSTDFDHHTFLSKHVTNRRIEKNIAKLLEEPDNDYEDLEMRIMADLHIRVWRDVWAEDYEEIIEENWVLDLDQLHNRVANKCAQHLEKLIQSGETPVVTVDPNSGRVLGDGVTAE